MDTQAEVLVTDSSLTATGSRSGALPRTHPRQGPYQCTFRHSGALSAHSYGSEGSVFGPDKPPRLREASEQPVLNQSSACPPQPPIDENQ